MQTSDTDCGPAALKCMLGGYGVRASYGRLREACRTDVDGTSIDAIEAVAVQLGLRADQMMLPVDHFAVAEAGIGPAIVVTCLPDGSTHFVVLWRRVGRWVQIMDPATGRRWLTLERFVAGLYNHSMPASATEWRKWAESDESVNVLQRQMASMNVSPRPHLDSALADETWRGLATLDAAVRMTQDLVRARALRRGRETSRALELLCQDGASIPDPYWSVRPSENSDEITLRGAVLINVYGVAKDAGMPESVELKAVLKEGPVRPGLELLHLLKTDGALVPATLLWSLVLAGGGVVVEAILLRGFLELPRELELTGQRMAAVAALCALLCFLLLLELPITASVLRYGRHLEVGLRKAFLEKIPRLADRYFQSRLKSDIAERSHVTHHVRHLPELASQIVRGMFELVFTAAGIAWIDPESAPLAIGAAVIALGAPVIAQPFLTERDLREQTLAGALSRYYLDALLGLIAIRAHRAERAIRRGHNRFLGEWARAGLSLQRAAVTVETFQLAIGYGLAAWLLFDHLGRRGELGSVLLLAYWALNLPEIGQQIADAAWQYPSLRNTTLRLMEPLGASEEPSGEPVSVSEPQTTARLPHASHSPMGASVVFQEVGVVAGGQKVLTDIDVAIQPGTHTAIVGPSGAGKSTLVGLLLGWHRPVEGKILFDGTPLDGRLDQVRRETAWVDPTVQLWNRSLYDNLCYGIAGDPAISMSEALEHAELRQMLEQLPNGFESSLGESGALVSGGEGQRVRACRSMLRTGVRLVILDEPFGGLDREQRRRLLERTCRLWRQATLLCITHDLAATRAFDRILIVEAGRIVEDGTPGTLEERPDSRYRALLDGEVSSRRSVWSDPGWRRLRLDRGKMQVGKT